MGMNMGTNLGSFEATNIVATPVASLGTAVRGVQTLGTAMPMDGTYYATAANGRIAYEVTRDGSDLSFDRLNPY
nr:hypothetical protein BaRGS_033440 [Batillaria attramentaria]